VKAQAGHTHTFRRLWHKIIHRTRVLAVLRLVKHRQWHKPG